jgi:hypothetical protein
MTIAKVRISPSIVRTRHSLWNRCRSQQRQPAVMVSTRIVPEPKPLRPATGIFGRVFSVFPPQDDLQIRASSSLPWLAIYTRTTPSRSGHRLRSRGLKSARTRCKTILAYADSI